MNVRFVLNDAPYGSERTYNGLRLAGALARREDVDVRVFLLGDSVVTAKSGQKVPKGDYNSETMLGAVVRRGGAVGVCGTCLDARGVAEAELAEGPRRSTLDELAQWTVDADKVLVF